MLAYILVIMTSAITLPDGFVYLHDIDPSIVEEMRYAGSHNFGTGYDCFDPLAHTKNPNLEPAQRQRRLLLISVMEAVGFENYPNEWWHFTLRREPFADRYFDFVVR